MNNCKDSHDGRHEFIVIGWKFRADYRTAQHFMCNKCMRLFEFEKISDRHVLLTNEENPGE